MAVTEISRIQVRRGQENQTGVPILDGGEFGWAVDTENLYIGLRRIDGGSRDANVRILTENDLRNLFRSANAISLDLDNANYTFIKDSYITSSTWNPPYPASEVVRTLQNKLDDFVSVKDFGAIGDGSNDDTNAIQTAVDNMYLESEYSTLNSPFNTSTEKMLFLPEGVYNISDTISLPPKVKIIGEGIENTKIRMISNGLHFFETVDGNSTGGSPINFDSDPATMGAPTPDYISIENLTLWHDSTDTQSLSFVTLDLSSYSTIKRVRFLGGAVSTDTNTIIFSSSTYVGVDLRGSTITSHNIIIEDCHFENLNAGIKSNYDVSDITINNCSFERLKYGVVFNNPIDSLYGTSGPRFVKISNNKFETIALQGIYVGGSSSPSMVTSQNNRFTNVGNRLSANGDSEPYPNTGTSIIFFASQGNSSINDYFEREYNQLSRGFVQPGTSSTYYPLIEGPGVREYTYTFGKTISIDNSPSQGNNTGTFFVFPITERAQTVSLKYHINVDNEIDRQGLLDISIPPGSNIQNDDIAFTDNFNYFTGSYPEEWSYEVRPDFKLIRFYLINEYPQGQSASFTIVNEPWPAYTGVTATGTYSNVTLVTGQEGQFFKPGDQIIIPGTNFSTGTFTATNTNSVYITVLTTASNGAISTFSWIGTATDIVNTSVFVVYNLESVRTGGYASGISVQVQPKILYS